MILGTGIDICDARRFQEQLASADGGLIGDVFTDAEVSYCRNKRFPARHFAARFAAKEAVVKALAAGGGQGMYWREIEILPAEGGPPAARLSGRIAELAAGLGVSRVWISLSHDGDVAVASAIVERAGD